MVSFQCSERVIVHSEDTVLAMSIYPRNVPWNWAKKHNRSINHFSKKTLAKLHYNHKKSNVTAEILTASSFINRNVVELDTFFNFGK